MHMPQELVSLLLSRAILLYTKPETIYWGEIQVFALDPPIQWENEESTAGYFFIDKGNTRQFNLCYEDRDRCVDYLLDVRKRVEDEEKVLAESLSELKLAMLLVFADICIDICNTLLYDRAYAHWRRNVKDYPSLQTLFRVTWKFWRLMKSYIDVLL